MSESNVQAPLDVVIVGAGFAGLYLLHSLRQRGLRVQVLEAADGVGGTWYWNRYPGARCDIESMEYSYSFDDALQQEWQWTERYAAQPEILRYINHVADRFDLRRDIRFNSRVVSAVRDDVANTWTLSTQDGAQVAARHFIAAVGCLSLPTTPEFKGRDDFKGQLYHTGLWPKEGVDFRGKRVGIIGTGSSGIQTIPQVAAQAEHLYVFQRTPHYSLPAANRPLEADVAAASKRDYAKIRETARRSSNGVSLPAPATQSVFDVPDDERARELARAWDHGGTLFLRLYTDLMVEKPANDFVAEFAQRKIGSIVRDPQVAALLTPSYPIGTKRICLDTAYYETYNRDNVSLVDVKSDPIDRITEKGVRTGTAEYELDALILATGFDAITGALLGMNIRNGRGESLADKWSAGPTTYLGLMTAGFPNLFMVTGPGSPSVLSNMVTSIEQHVEWIVQCLDDLAASRRSRIEAEQAAEDAWVLEVNAAANKTLMGQGNSWYLGANVPGKPRVFMPYAGGVGNYRQICERVVADGYTGFAIA